MTPPITLDPGLVLLLVAMLLAGFGFTWMVMGGDETKPKGG